MPAYEINVVANLDTDGDGVSDAIVPTGATVTVSTAGMLITSGTITAGVCTIDMDAFGAGTYTVDCIYSGYVFVSTPPEVTLFAPGSIGACDLLGSPATRRCFNPGSSWVHKVCWIPRRGIQVTFKNGPTGAPYITVLYPNTTYADYQFFLLAASAGRHIHGFYYRMRAYVIVPLDA